jgi:hypothetical protein
MDGYSILRHQIGLKHIFENARKKYIGSNSRFGGSEENRTLERFRNAFKFYQINKIAIGEELVIPFLVIRFCFGFDTSFCFIKDGSVLNEPLPNLISMRK